MGVVIGCFLEVIGEIEMCSKIPDCDSRLWWETKEEFEERQTFFEEGL